MREFECAAGTFTGREHLVRGVIPLGGSNQDAYLLHCAADAIVAVVCDGCGSAEMSDVGSRLGVRWIARAVQLYMQRHPGALDHPDARVRSRAWKIIRSQVLTSLRRTARTMGPEQDLDRILHDYFLFTSMVLVMTPVLTQVRGIGDGIFIRNGEVIQIDEFPGNAPPYLAYAAFKAQLPMPAEALHFRDYLTVATGDMQSVGIGTDGAADFLHLAQSRLPGKQRVVGPVSQFWSDDTYFSNPFALQRLLSLINTTHVGWHAEQGRVIREQPLLPDDTTLVIVRRKRGGVT